MKRLETVLALVALLLSFCTTGEARSVIFESDFNAPWSGDYAPNWQNVSYRHGDAAQSLMMQQSTIGRGGTPGVEVSITAAGVPESSTNWWGGVSPTDVPQHLLDKVYNPSISIWYYDASGPLNNPVGQLAAVPTSETQRIDGFDADWTDVQFGARWHQPDFWYGQAPDGWLGSTGVPRSQGSWHRLELSLGSSGQITYKLDDYDGSNLWTGTTTRTDYVSLTGTYVMNQFDDDDFAHSASNWDDFRIESDATALTSAPPEPSGAPSGVSDSSFGSGWAADDPGSTLPGGGCCR